jgi:RNA-binding protein 7
MAPVVINKSNSFSFVFLGPLERVAIPKEKDGKNKSFGFVTYKHLVAIPYALNVFNGTKLFGRELLLKNRNTNSNSNRNSFSSPATPSSSLTSMAQNPLLSAISDQCMVPNMNMPSMGYEQQQQQFFNQQQFLNQQLFQLSNSMPIQMFNSGESAFPSTLADQIGSLRERDFVDRNRYHRDDNRSKPYNRRSRSRSPQFRNRSRSPNNNNNNNRNRERDRRRDDRGYHRWNYRK